MKIYAFFQGLFSWSLCIASPLFADADFIQRMLGLSEAEMRAYWNDISVKKETQTKIPEEIDVLAQEVEKTEMNEKLKNALESLKEVVSDSASSVESYESSISSVKEALASVQERDSQGSFSEAELYGKINKELAKASIDLEQRKAINNAKNVAAIPSSTCSPVQVIANPGGFAITAPGHYCVATDIVANGITITSSNVELNLDLHNVSGFIGIFIDGSVNRVSNVKISGAGVVVGIAAIGMLNAENVTIENITVTGGFGFSILNSTGITLKNVFANGFGGSIFNETRDLKIISSSFTSLDPTSTFGTAIMYRGSSTDFRIDNCVFDGNFSGVNIFPGDTTQSLERLAITNSFISNSTSDALFVQNTSEFALKNTLIDSAVHGVVLQNVTDFQMANTQILNTTNQGLEIVDAVTNVEVDTCQFLGTGRSPVDATHLTNGKFSNSLFSTMTPNPHAGMNFSESEGIEVTNCILSALLQDPTVSGTNGIAFQKSRGFSLKDSIIETNARGTANLGGNDVLIAYGSVNGSIENCILRSIQPNVAAYGVRALGKNKAIRIENNTIDGADVGGVHLEGTEFSLLQNNLICNVSQGSGVMLKGAVGIALFANTIVGNAKDGIHLDNQTINSTLRDNTITKNGHVGLNNKSKSRSNKIYHNYAQANDEKNYSEVDLVAEPHVEVGVLENISS